MRTASIAFLVSALSLVACGGASTPPTDPSQAAPSAAPSGTGAASAIKAPGEAKVGDKTTCPVSGEEFVVDANSLKVEHEGKTYYFCCGGCKKKFESDPSKFVKKT